MSWGHCGRSRLETYSVSCPMTGVLEKQTAHTQRAAEAETVRFSVARPKGHCARELEEVERTLPEPRRSAASNTALQTWDRLSLVAGAAGAAAWAARKGTRERVAARRLA